MGKPKATFRGGYYFRNFQGVPRPEILDLQAPRQVILPLQQGFGCAPKLCVKPGDEVKAGQVVACDNDSVCSPVLATIGGKVQEVKEILYRGKTVQAVVVEGNGRTDEKILGGAAKDFGTLDAARIGELLYLSGASALGVIGIPTLHKSSPIVPDDVKYLVVSAIHSDPLATPMSAYKAEDVAKGIQILRRLFPQAEVRVGVSKKEGGFAAELVSKLADPQIRVCRLAPKYPQECPPILAETLTGAKIPYGKGCEAIGAVVVDVPAVLACYEAVALGKPMLSRTVAISGTGYRENLIARVRIGTTVREIAAKWGKPDMEVRHIFGNVLVGDRVDLDTPIGREVDAVAAIPEDRKRQFMFFMRPGFAADSYSNVFASKFLPVAKKTLGTNIQGEGRACVQCSYCSNVCPRPMLPQLLSKYCTHGLEEDAKGIRLLACVECGLCTYVCPSKIPIMTNLQKGVAKLKEEGLIG